MAAKFDAAMLKKHHFWFLFVFVLIGLVLAWIGLFWDVPDETLKTAGEQKTKQDGLKSTQAKARSLIAGYTKQVNELQASRVNMWRQAWHDQKDLYFWPTRRPSADNDPFKVIDPQRAFFLDEPNHGFTEKQLAVVANRRFGEDIPNTKETAVREQFGIAENYEAAYKRLIADLQPMQCRDDNWQAVLNYIPRFGKIPTSEEIWLAMEDLWVQREILMRIHQVNLDAAKFASTSDLAGQVVGMAGGLLIEKPNHRVFRSRVWRLDLQLVDENNKRVVKGSLTNLTDRLQVLGIGNALRLNIWTGEPRRTAPFPFEIEGVSVPARNTLPIKYIPAHELPSEWPARGLFKVEQVFDIRTIPVKRIEYFEIGKLSDRNNNLPLRMAKFSEDAARKEAPVTASSGSESRPGPMGTPSPMGLPGPMGAPMGQTYEGAAPVLNARTREYQLNRLRYIDVTGQLRRMPIGFVVVTDQSYMKDIVESVANTKMRFQTTQVEWSRFHHTLYYRNPGATYSGIQRGMGEEAEPGPVGRSGPMYGAGFRYNTSGPENSSQDQYSANLMELSVYGLLSLYEKYDEPKGGTPKPPSYSPPVKEKEPTPPAKEKGKDGIVPMPPKVKQPAGK